MIRRKYIKLGILFLMFSIFLISNISAQPPPTTSIVININTGITTDFPRQNIFEQNQPYHFHFHVYNISDGLRLDNTTTNCSFELFDNKGNHLINAENIGFLDDDFEINVTGGNFSRLGDYHYSVDCVTATIGGFVSVSLKVTQTGQVLDEPQSLIILGLILVLLLTTWVFLYFGNEIEYVPFKIFLISLGVLFLMFTVGFSLNIIRNLVLVGSVFSLTFVNLYRLMLILISAGGIGLMVYIIYMSVKQFYNKRGLLDEHEVER